MKTPHGPGARVGGGNFTNGDVNANVVAQFQALSRLGAGMCRINVYPSVYLVSDDWNRPNPRVLDRVMEEAHRHNITPVLLLEYYAEYHPRIGFGSETQWRELGRALAARFRPGGAWARERGIRDFGISVYTAMNEPENTGMGRDKTVPGLGPDVYAAALRGLSHGVRSVGRGLKVLPGGFKNANAFRDYTLDGLGPVLAPLWNDGTLDGIDLHTYYDVDYAPMEATYARSAQRNFDDVKRACGVRRADVGFYSTEFNYKLRGPNDKSKPPVTEAEAACGLLTAFFDNLGVVGPDGGTPVTGFAFPWNLFNRAEGDREFGMNAAAAANVKEPWSPTLRARTLAMVLRLSDGLRVVRCDPRRSGTFLLRGNGKSLLAWQNRPGWTDRLGERFTLRGLPRAAATIAVYGWNGPRRRVAKPAGATEVEITGLAPGETNLFVWQEQ